MTNTFSGLTLTGMNLTNEIEFDVIIPSGSTHIVPTNISAGQTINISASTISGASVTFASSIKQPSGSLYSPTQSTSTDILTMVSFDSSNINLVATKNLV
jgi:hypothetical protein